MNQVVIIEKESLLVIENPSQTLVVTETEIELLEVGVQGPPGANAASYTHVQSSPSVQWTINHNLGFNPNVELRNTGGQIIIADLIHTSVNQVIAYFNVAVAGSATCS